MSKVLANRRSFLSRSLAASVFAPLAGLFAGRAKAAEYTLEQFVADVITAKAAGQRYHYRLACQKPDGSVYGLREQPDLRSAVLRRKWIASHGWPVDGVVEIQRRPVGEWKMACLRPDGTEADVLSGTFPNLELAKLNLKWSTMTYRAWIRAGFRFEIQRRPVGDWETI
jgi:hypothetical protein